MRTPFLVVGLLLAFVAVPGAILAFHSAPAPAHVDPGAEKLLAYIDSLGLHSVDCVARNRRVLCSTGTDRDAYALSSALYQHPIVPSDCEGRGDRMICVIGTTHSP